MKHFCVLACLALAAACSSPREPSIEITELLVPSARAADACNLLEAREGPALFDLGPRDARHAFVQPMRISPSPEDGGVQPVRADTFLARSDGETFENEAIPASVATVRQTNIAGTIINQDVQPPADIIFPTLLAAADADALANDAAIAQALSTSDGRVRVDAHVTIHGFAFDSTTSGAADVLAREVSSAEVVVPIDLCIGCIVPGCDDGDVLRAADGAVACMVGVDVPLECAPAE